jgi:hypothetical protein
MVDELSFGLRTARACASPTAPVSAPTMDSARAPGLELNTTDSASVLGLGSAAVDLAVGGLRGGPLRLQGAAGNSCRARVVHRADCDSASRLASGRITFDVGASARGRGRVSGGLMGIDEDSNWEDSGCEERAGCRWRDSSRANSRVSNRVNNSNCVDSSCVDSICMDAEGRDREAGLMHEQLSQVAELMRAHEWEMSGQHVTIALLKKQLEEQQVKLGRLEADQMGWYAHQPDCRCVV